WFAILALTLICSLPFEFTTEARAMGAMQGTASISGRVTIKGEPAKGVAVFLQPQQTMESGANEKTPSAKTNENGYFRITGLPAGRYTPISLTPGYIMSKGGTDFTMARGDAFDITEGEVIDNFDIDLIPGGVITGRVTDSNGRPLVEEQVHLWYIYKNGTLQEWSTRLIRKMLTTDDRGVYRIFGLVEGRYILSAGGYSKGEDGYVQRTYHPDVTDKSQAKVVEVGAGQEVTGIDINVAEVEKTYSVFGRVVNADDGKPVGGAKVELRLLSPDGNDFGGERLSDGQSDSKGAFQISNAPPGKYIAYMKVDLEPDNALNQYCEPVICEVTNSDVQGIEIKLRNGGSIEGVVVIEDPTDPAMSVKTGKIECRFYSVEAKPGEFSSPYFKLFHVAPNGSFKVEGLPKGRVGITTFNPVDSVGSSLIRIERDGAPLPGDSIEIGAGEHISNLRLVTATPNLSLSGAIKVVGGSLPPDLALYIYASRLDGARGARPGEVDFRNNFVIQYLSPGEYELRLKIPDYTAETKNVDPQLSRAISQARQKVVVSRNNQQPVIMTLDLSQGGAK
ncbi:MAG TPA: carboxypeptidase-like regulatory domain-containing protein, partial [Blastocatellia bacterium]|nr:carboxypeptidase-like regulatory domain-containing protein [Blastocatellia bacterium]